MSIIEITQRVNKRTGGGYSVVEWLVCGTKVEKVAHSKPGLPRHWESQAVVDVLVKISLSHTN